MTAAGAGREPYAAPASLPDMLWTGRPDGYIDYCNRRWLDFTGMTHDEIQGSGWMKAFHPEDVEHTGRSWHRVSDVGLPLEQAVPCGLIINELVTNALKHGFPDNRSGSVTVGFGLTDEQTMLLRVYDDGVGISPGIDPASSSTLGLLMVFELTSQLLGRLTLERPAGGGTDFRVAFPVRTNLHPGGLE